MMMNDQINVFKTALVTRQNELINQIQRNNNFDLQMSEKDSVGELSSYDNHPADMGTELFERGKDIALNEHAENELEKINEALHAINEGTYGICSVCGVDIPFERLEALPTADTCTEHAHKEIFNQGERPVEEEVLNPNLNPVGENDVDQVSYDEEDAWQEVSRYGTSETPSDLYGDQDNYNEMYPNSDELVGSAEEVEGILGANIHGEYSDDSQGYD